MLAGPAAAHSIDAVVLAGGRGSRLDGAVKAAIRVDGTTLLERAVAAALTRCRRVAVVVDPRARGLADRVADDERVLAVVEDPPYAGPAVALRRGLAALRTLGDEAGSVLVLACDLADPDAVVDLLAGSLLSDGHDGPDGPDGAVLVDPDGHRQWVAGRYRTPAVTAAVADATSMRGALSGLRLSDVPVDPAVCADIDTDDDLRAWRDRARGDDEG